MLCCAMLLDLEWVEWNLLDLEWVEWNLLDLEWVEWEYPDVRTETHFVARSSYVNVRKILRQVQLTYAYVRAGQGWSQ